MTDRTDPERNDGGHARDGLDEPCPMCMSRRGRVAVHGHLQCLACGNNVDPCCGGAPLA